MLHPRQRFKKCYTPFQLRFEFPRNWLKIKRFQKLKVKGKKLIFYYYLLCLIFNKNYRLKKLLDNINKKRDIYFD